MSKPRIAAPQRRQPTIKEWHDNGPSSKVTRAELMKVLEGFEFVPAEEVARLIQNGIVLERNRAWYRRLWNWAKVTMWQKKTIADLSPAARAKVRAQLDQADAPKGGDSKCDGGSTTQPSGYSGERESGHDSVSQSGNKKEATSE